jgi:hypothetical protein
MIINLDTLKPMKIIISEISFHYKEPKWVLYDIKTLAKIEIGEFW